MPVFKSYVFASMVLCALWVRPAWAQYADLASFSTTMELNGGLFEEPCASFVLSKLFKCLRHQFTHPQQHIFFE
jgi:hypothetical protein